MHPPYWVFPIISGVVWLGMLLGLLIHWCVNTHYEIYSFEPRGQTIAYISDVGAGELKPLFIAGSCVTAVFLDLAFVSDHWLRHRGRLVPNTTTGEKILSLFTILWAIVGTCGLVLLTIFDTQHYKRLHDIFLLLFLAGYVLSAIFICWHIQRLGKHYAEHRDLRVSFWIKLFFIVIEIILAIAFVACNFTNHNNVAAVLEWVVAFIFSFYIFSFCADLWPAVRTHKKAHGPHSSPRQMEEAGSDGRLTGQYSAGGTNGYANGYTNGTNSGGRHF